MEQYLASVNGGAFYAIVAVVLVFITAMCFVFLIKSYVAGVRLGMDKKVLRKTITASATFTLLPSISILLGVIALSGTLGVPFSWLRLSIIGALQYELNVAEIAAQSIGLSGLTLSELTIEGFVTIALVMTLGILGGVFCCIFFLKKYLGRLQSPGKKKRSDSQEGSDRNLEQVQEQDLEQVQEQDLEQVQEQNPGQGQNLEHGQKQGEGSGFGAHATTAMFVGLCAAYIGSYIGKAMPGGGTDGMPLFVAAVAGASMAVFEYLVQKKRMLVLENFSLAASMLIAMAAAVLVNR